MIQLNFRDAKPIYEQIKEEIRQLIVTSGLVPEDRLPSVRELAAGLAINPNTIARAYQELEQEGYLYTVRGKGTFVGNSTRISDYRRDELMETLDEIIGELTYLELPKEELVKRVEEAIEGETHDFGK